MPSADLVVSAALVATVACVVALLLARWFDPLGVAAVVALVGMQQSVTLVSDRVVVAAVLAAVVARTWPGVVAGCFALAPVGLLALQTTRSWTSTVTVEVFFVLATVVAVLGATAYARQVADGWFLSVLLTITAAGVYAGPPDTETSTLAGSAMAAVAAAFALPGVRPLVGRQMGAIALAVFVVAWSALLGSVDRPASIIGAFGCFGLIVVEPVVLWFRRLRLRSVVRPTAPGRLARVAIHLVVVGVCSRGAALRADVAVPLLVTVLALAGGGMAATVVGVYESERSR